MENKNQLKRNAKDKVFKNLLETKQNLAQFYFDLTGKKINPDEIRFDSIATKLVKGKEEDGAFRLGERYIILFEAQSTWNIRLVLRFATYMFILFTNFVEEYWEQIFEQDEEFRIPIVEAYVIYTGNRNLPEKVSLKESYKDLANSMIDAELKIVTLKNSKGMVKEYIGFAQLETKYFREGKRTKEDILDLIKEAIKKGFLKDYLKDRISEVTTLIENFFTEERRIKDIVNDAVREAVNETRSEDYEKFEAERKQMQSELNQIKENEIRRLFNLGLSNERIHKETGYSLDFINNALKND